MTPDPVLTRRTVLAAAGVSSAAVLARPLVTTSAHAGPRQGPADRGGTERWDPVDFRSWLTAAPPDPTAVTLGTAGFAVHGDGVGDDTEVLQEAVDEASRRGIENKLGDILGGQRDFAHGDGGGVVLVPSGTYRLSDTIQIHDSVRIIGVGRKRPRFLLGAGSPGYAQGEPRDVFAFRRRPYGAVLTYANNDTFGSGLVNLDITIEAGNPDAVAVRFGGAQLCILQDLDITVGDGFAGVDHNANVLQRVRINGGEIGLNAFAASAGWPTTVVDCRFTGQRRAAVVANNDAKLVLVRNAFADTPTGIETVPEQSQRLHVESSHFDGVDRAVLLNDSESLPGAGDNDLIRYSNQLNLVQCTARATPVLLRLAQSGAETRAPGSWVRIEDLSYGLRVDRALSRRPGREDGVHAEVERRASPRVVRELLTSDAPALRDARKWVSVADVAAELGVEIGIGGDDLPVFQAAVDQHRTVFVPIGKYLFGGTLRLRRDSHLIGLHPRQTWLAAIDEHRHFADRRRPRAVVETPRGGHNLVVGLGVDTAVQTPGSVSLLWQSAESSYLADVTTQFVKWHPDDVQSGDPGYTYRGRHKYGIWVRGGGGTMINIWSAAGWSENGLLVEGTDTPARLYELSIEHHETREIVLRGVRNWRFYGLQTEDHIYGWRSQALELDRCSDLSFANSVLFRVATVLGPHPYAISTRDCRRLTFRGNRGYRDKTPEYTQWGAALYDHDTGRRVDDLEYALVRTGKPRW